ncbi:hypothetical protein HK104_005813, partial [Borealophlyctis nickersoniae]
MHSSLSELQNLVGLLRPQQVFPCVTDTKDLTLCSVLSHFSELLGSPSSIDDVVREEEEESCRRVDEASASSPEPRKDVLASLLRELEFNTPSCREWFELVFYGRWVIQVLTAYRNIALSDATTEPATEASTDFMPSEIGCGDAGPCCEERPDDVSSDGGDGLKEVDTVAEEAASKDASGVSGEESTNQVKNTTQGDEEVLITSTPIPSS